MESFTFALAVALLVASGAVLAVAVPWFLAHLLCNRTDRRVHAAVRGAHDSVARHHLRSDGGVHDDDDLEDAGTYDARPYGRGVLYSEYDD